MNEIEHKASTHTITFTFILTPDPKKEMDHITTHMVRSGDMDIDLTVYEITKLIREWCDSEEEGFELFCDAEERRN